MDPEVAVIVPTHNRADLLAETIEAILGQENARFRLYVVDDGSTDDTPALLARYAARHSNVVPIAQTNAGQAAALNHGIRSSTEPLIALCDADDLWHPRRLETSVRALRAAPDAGFACTDFSRGTDPNQPWISAWTEHGYAPESSGAFDRLLLENFVHRSSATIRRERLERVGLFSEEIAGRCGCDDWDMWLKLARTGPAVCIHEVLVWARQWPGQDSSTVRAVESRVRLWRHWKQLLKSEPGLPRIASRNLASHLLALAWAYRKENKLRPAAGAYCEALLSGHLTGDAMTGLLKLLILSATGSATRQNAG